MAGSARRSRRPPSGASSQMKPATESPAPVAASPFPIDKVRAAFPALERQINGRPLAYLDSGASSQRVLASIQAVERLDHRQRLLRGGAVV